MDFRAVVDRAAERTLSAEQAIFTSIRSPMGEGYRVVACSRGLDAADKRELTRRSPSHGGLWASQAAAVGWSSYPLAHKRWCVAVSQHAGREHTGRGGLRVYTRLVVLTEADYRHCGCDPSRVVDAVIQAVGPPELKPPPHLERLALVCRPTAEAPGSPATQDLDGLLALLAAALQGGPTVVHGCPDPHAALREVYRLLPVGLRRLRTVSCNLKFSAARACELTVLPPLPPGEALRIPEGRFEVWPWAERPGALHGPFDAWLAFVRRALQARRGREVAELAAQLDQEGSPGTLQQIAALCDDIAAVQTADAAALDRLLIRNHGQSGVGSMHAELLEQLREAVAHRREALADVQATAAMPSISRSALPPNGGWLEDGLG